MQGISIEGEMTHWIRFQHAGATGFGIIENDRIAVHEGDMFDAPKATGEHLSLHDVAPLAPTAAGKMLALWNNFYALATKLNQEIPPEPLYFIKANGSYLSTGGIIRKPPAYDGKVVFEGELGIVIGSECRAVAEADAGDHVFGYTCINDVTAVELIGKDATFAQWTRAKSFDTFGVFGPVVATGLDPSTLSIRTVLNDQERQSYPVSDMIFGPAEIVSMISQDMTLHAGDVICCGTSIGVGSMKPGSTIEVTIDGIGTLSNRYEN
jgi:2-keto-4-pentenoate hydratase/2-oxohepta-3-ene-1,7-dioic acid hydratase in catechol pathway